MIEADTNKEKIWTIGSLNIQAGIQTNTYRDYIMKSWHNVYPHIKYKNNHIIRISRAIQNFDVFGMQEIDIGSLRSCFQNQSNIICREGKFKNSICQLNRNLGVSTTANGLFSKHHLSNISFLPLPSSRGRYSSRGAIIALVDDTWWCCVTHFSLYKKSRLYQSAFLSEILEDKKKIILMGDFNDTYNSWSLSPLYKIFKNHTTGRLNQLTYPRWKPIKCIDLIWWKGIEPIEQRVFPVGNSDHCAVSIKFKI